MKFSIIVFYAFLITVGAACSTQKVVYQNLKNSSMVSVMDYGAKGDGVTDDTEAIQKALEVINKRRVSRNRFGNAGGTKVYLGTVSTLYFPSGHYRISSPIDIGHYQRIIGENAIIEPYSEQNNQCISGLGWQLEVQGLQFVGFSTAIDINNKNLDIGHILIEKCTFANNNIAIRLKAQSSISNITKCRFFSNDKVLIVDSGDKVFLTESWISSKQLRGKHDAQIVNYGMLHFKDNLLVPSVPIKGAFEPAWINNYGSIDIDGVRQGGEPGSFTLVNNFSEADLTYPIIPASVNVRNTDSYAVYGNRKNFRQPAVLRLVSIPNSINISQIRGMVDAVTIGISEDANKNVSELAKKISEGKLEDKINISVKGLTGGFYKYQDKVLPKTLQKMKNK